MSRQAATDVPAADQPGSPDPSDFVLGPLGDLPPDVLRAQLHRVADWVADYRETIERRTIVPSALPGDMTARIPAEPPHAPEPLDRILADLDAVVMPGIVHWGHPAFLGYFGSTSNGPALLGEIVAAALNVSAMTWRTSPAATELETVVLGWIRQMLGIPDAFFGIVYDTASVAVVHALAAARERAGASIRSRGIAGRPELLVQRVYASEQAHSSIAKAMIVLGLGESNLVRIPTDAEYRLDVEALDAVIAADVARGHRPMAVVATVGTTSTASVDPVTGIAAVCRKHGAWLHVDAAYGGALGILPEGRWAMAGVDEADSVVVNPHKWLFVPLDFSVLYTRHPDLQRSVFSLVPEYLRGDASHDAAIDYMDYGIQLGRRFRALKAWMVFRAMGRDGIAARIREHCRLARLFAGWVDAEPMFDRAASVSMGVVCFRYAPEGPSEASIDRLNEAIVARVNAAGDAYVTHTQLAGRTVMRVGFGNVLTTERHAEAVWARVLSEARATHREWLGAPEAFAVAVERTITGEKR
jgi:aromatic-L-amino-acid/L-tryptophan decarboxylase